MKLAKNMTGELTLAGSHSLSIFAVNAAFDVREKSTMKASLSATKDAVTNDFEKAGFQMLGSPLEFSKISSAKANIASGLKSDVQDNSHARVELAVDPGFEAVALELDPQTNEVLGWVFPTAVTQPSVRKNAGLAQSIEPTSLSTSNGVIFELPLNSPNVESSRVSAKASLSVGDVLAKGAKKLFQIVLVKTVKKLTRKAVSALLKRIDRTRGKDDHLWRVKTDGSLVKASKASLANMSGKRVLLFVHGIISSTNGAFGSLYQATAASDFFAETKDQYGSNYIGYEHWTLSKSITKNATEMLNQLPRNTTIDIVCHSRGAGVVRSLMENPKFANKIKAKKINFDKVCFVAGACEGSDLASQDALDRLFRVINSVGVLTGIGSIGSSTIALALKAILGGAQNAPGTDSMDPTGKEMSDLKNSTSTHALSYNYARANFDSSKWYLSAADQVLIDSIIFKNKPNDVVVPYIGAGPNTDYLKDADVKKTGFYSSGSKTQTDPDVWHINFFQDEEFRRKLIELLNKS